MILISIITINYNNCHGLLNTLNSINNQSYKNFELIVIDGKSKDDSITIIKDFYYLINKYIIEKDTGIYNAMNKGIKFCKGNWLIYLNSGDIFYNNDVLKSFINNIYIFNNNYDIIYGSTYMENKIIIPKKNLGINDFILGLPFCHQSVFVSSRIYNKYIFNERYKIFSDLIYFRQCYIDDIKFKKINLIISNFNDEGTSSKYNLNHLIEIFFINYKNYLFLFLKKYTYKIIHFIYKKTF
jgi:glycosyltransferase involved in cell wall biosynthesis